MVISGHQTGKLEVSDLSFTGLFAGDSGQAFEKLFTDWFGSLHAYAFSLLKDDAEAEEAVQAVFCRIWERRNTLSVRTTLKVYLYGSVYHECMDHLRRRKKQRKGQSRFPPDATIPAGQVAGKVELGQLEARFARVLEELPEQCRHIFQLSRFGELRYKEIAEQLGISVKTVEAQMSKALKILRSRLADHL